MTKKLLYIALGGMFVFGILFLLWSWLFGSGGTAGKNGLFGTASSTSQTFGNATDVNNGQAQLGSNTANGTVTVGNNGKNTGVGGNGAITNGTTGGGTNGTGTNGTGTNGTGTNGTGIKGTGTTGAGTIGAGGTAGVTTKFLISTSSISTSSVWIGGTGNTSGGNVRNFTPAEINSLTGNISGSAPVITNKPNGGGGGTSQITALAGAAVAGAVSCGIRATAITSGAAAGSTAAAGVLAQKPISVPVSTGSDSVVAYNAASQTALQNGSEATSFAGCIVNVLAKAALQQITVSVVNWINSGFNGQPSFVTNYNQFFTNVADAAAGQFIKNSPELAFLCSPFKLQIKVAIAQSYAQRNNAKSCTLTSVIKNVNSFMNGNFSQGGWSGLLSVTTIPTNNPYGAYAYAQIGISNAQSSALQNAKNNISPTGFLNLQELYGCDVASNNGLSGGANIGSNPQAAVAGGKTALPSGCKTKVVTPGGAIASSLDSTLKQGQDQLGLGNSLDQIFNALTTQLLTKTLYGGLSSLSGQTTTRDTSAEQKAAALIVSMEKDVTIAQQYGSIEQGSIRDIQDAERKLNNVFNCWNTAASSTGMTAAQVATATGNAALANTTIKSLELSIGTYNNNITHANDIIAQLQELITEATQAASAADVNNVSNKYAAAQPFITQNDVTTEQQNRVTLQSQLTTTNQATQSSLAQCQPFGH